MTVTLTRIWETIRSKGRGQFLVTPERSTSYASLQDQIRQVCGFFDTHDLAPGDRITIALSDEVLASATFVAALLDGLVPVMLSPDAAEVRRKAIADFVDARLRIDDAAPPPVQTGLLQAFRAGSTPKRSPRLPDVAPDDAAYVLFTSGTTSDPRGVTVTFRNLMANLETMIRLFGYDRDARIFNATPLAHTDGLVQGPILAAASGAALLRPGRFEVGRLEPFLDFLRSERATHMITSPTLLSIINRMAQETDYFDRSRFRGALCTGGILPEALWTAVEAKFGITVWNVYGMTESVANALYAGDHPEMGTRGTIGRPVDCLARIAGGEETGELELSGDNITTGYWRNPALSQESRTKDGWFRTGDIVAARADGSYEFLGRVKAIINQGGVRIHPGEINESLMSHAQVVEAATFAIPDADFEEIAISAVVTAHPIEAADLMAHCNARLEPLKRPKRIVTMASIPKTDTGKADIPGLRNLFVGAVKDTSATNKIPSPLEMQVLDIAARVFALPKDGITIDTPSENIRGWDSFNHLKLMMEIEEAFDINLSTKEIVSVRNLRALVETISSHVSQTA